MVLKSYSCSGNIVEATKKMVPGTDLVSQENEFSDLPSIENVDTNTNADASTTFSQDIASARGKEKSKQQIGNERLLESASYIEALQKMMTPLGR